MFSWFPFFFPVRETIQCYQPIQIDLNISRKNDNEGVWYEWKTNYQVINKILIY